MNQEDGGQQSGQGQKIDQQHAPLQFSLGKPQVDVEEYGIAAAELPEQKKGDGIHEGLDDEGIHEEGVGDAEGQPPCAYKVIRHAYDKLGFPIVPDEVDAVANGHTEDKGPLGPLITIYFSISPSGVMTKSLISKLPTLTIGRKNLEKGVFSVFTNNAPLVWLIEICANDSIKGLGITTFLESFSVISVQDSGLIW